MNTWFFEDPKRVTLLRKEAAEWVNTPFRKFSRAKGPGGGVDCFGLMEALSYATGVGKETEFKFPRCDADYSSAATFPRALRYLRGKEWRDPQSARLESIFVELPLPEFRGNPPSDFFIPGDALILRRGGQLHVCIMLDGRRFVSAVPEIGVREGDLHDPSYNEHLIAAFRARAVRTGLSPIRRL